MGVIVVSSFGDESPNLGNQCTTVVAIKCNQSMVIVDITLGTCFIGFEVQGQGRSQGLNRREGWTLSQFGTIMLSSLYVNLHWCYVTHTLGLWLSIIWTYDCNISSRKLYILLHH